MKLFRKLVVVTALIGAFGMTSYAEKGDFGVGINLGVAPSVDDDIDVTNFGIGFKAQYNFTTPIRGEFEFTYWCESDHLSAFELVANVHYLFRASRIFTMYPVVGIGYGQPRIEFGDAKVSYDRFLFNLGLGGEFDVARNWSAGIEVKYQYMKDFSRIPITVGLTYRF